MKKLFISLLSVVLGCLALTAGPGNFVKRIDYQAQKKGIKGYYEVFYNKDNLLSMLGNTGGGKFDSFYANSYLISGPEKNMTTLKVLSENVELLAVYNCLVKGLRDAYMSYNITDLGKGSATFTKETSKVEVPIKGAVYPMVVSGVNKFKDQSVSEVTLTVRGAKIDRKSVV